MADGRCSDLCDPLQGDGDGPRNQQLLHQTGPHEAAPYKHQGWYYCFQPLN